MGTTQRSHLPFFIKHRNSPLDSFYPLVLYWGLVVGDGWHRGAEDWA